ncbi:phosphotransferase [Streptacidiphilus albus]|uniref:phosphotransferase n=1 Tax=Streptacidiphilus albus TaxID=105425 RepID=UPI00054C7695|nr:phosphotransferase [Streptacidiphilus albus]
MIEDGEQASGAVTTVVRVGETIRRPTGVWTPAVHALLDHLEQGGFAGAPRPRGIDEHGREVLTLLRGEVAMRPWPAELVSGDGLWQLARWLREYHDAVADFVPPADAAWFVPGATWQPGQIVRHGDLGPWNSVWHDGVLVGFIDWDFAEPGAVLDDVAQLAWYAVPLRGPEMARAAGLAEDCDLRARLAALCQGYGVSAAAVLDALEQLIAREIARLDELGSAGVEPWSTFRERGDRAALGEELGWLIDGRSSLISDE